MSNLSIRSLALLISTAAVAFAIVKTMDNSHAAANQSFNKTDVVDKTDDTSTNGNPLLAKWEGPYGGVPPFDRVQISYFKPALEAAMTEQLAEVDKIAKNPAAPTFENTIVAMETAGATFDRVGTIYGVWGATMNGPEFQSVQREMAPKLAAFGDQITQNEALLNASKRSITRRPKRSSMPEQQRLVWLDYTNFRSFRRSSRTRAKARLSQSTRNSQACLLSSVRTS
jgi:peptidyl-dipeptidase Dcp